MVDFHTHILPYIDDGPNHIKESINMLKYLKSQGLTNIVLTPHYYCLEQSVENFIAKRKKSFSALIESIAENDFAFLLGAEVLLHKNLFLNNNIDLLKIENTDYMLVELNFNRNIEQTLYYIEQLIYSYNVIPIIAHIENYSYFKRHPNAIIELIELGCLIQINTSSINNTNKKFILKLIKHNFAHLIGTDCHNTTSRKPDLSAFKQAIQKRELDWFLDYVKDNGNNIIKNNKVEIKPPIPMRKSLIL